MSADSTPRFRSGIHNSRQLPGLGYRSQARAWLDKLLMQQRPDIRITGLDLLVRPETAIPVALFDGRHFPLPDQSCDGMMFVDVLHHTGWVMDLLKEAVRVGKAVVIKDHLDEGLASNATL